MRRSVLIAAACAASAVAAGQAAAEPAPAGTSVARSGLASVRVVDCLRGERSATFQGRMKAVRRSRRMAMRFSLIERSGSGAPRAVVAPGLGVWRTSKPGVRAFRYRQRVLGLSEGSSYRARVDFRWFGTGSKVIRRARRKSVSCKQFAALPNLRVVSIALARRDDLPRGVWRYRVSVRNGGKVQVSEAALRLAVDGATVDTRTIASLGPGEIDSVTFTGPACESGRSTVSATADPEGAVGESSEQDNVRTAPCSALPR